MEETTTGSDPSSTDPTAYAPSATGPAPAPSPPIPVEVTRRPRSTGKLLGRDLPQKSPGASGKRPWGRACRKIDVLLTSEQREAFDQLLANPRTTRKSAHAWLAEQGVRVSLGAVTRYRNAFEDDTAPLRDAARTAAWVVRTAEEGRGERIPSAALSMIEQFVMQALMRHGSRRLAAARECDDGRDAAARGEADDAKYLRTVVRTLSTSIDARRRLLKLTQKLERVRKAASTEKVSPRDVAIRMREILCA